MAKKKFGKLLVFAAITGAVAAGIAYFNRKKDSEVWDDDLDDFDEDFDDEDFDFPLPTENEESSVKREYVSLNIDKETAEEEASKAEETATSDANPEKVQDTATDSEASDDDDTAV